MLQLINKLQSQPSIDILKQLRDAMTNQKNQDELGEVFMMEDIQKIIFSSALYEEIEQSQNYQYPLYFVQFLCNFITGNNKNKDLLLESLELQERLLKLIESNEEVRLRRASLIMTFNMIKGNQLTEEIVFSNKFFSQLVLILLSRADIEPEWSVYLLMEIQRHNFQTSLISKLFDQDQFYFFLFHLLQKTIDDRQTTEIVIGLPPEISDVKDLYKSETPKIYLQLTQADVQFLQKKYELACGEKCFKSQSRLLKMFCLITFIGGYNRSVQTTLFTTFQLTVQQLILIRSIYEENKLQDLEEDISEDFISIHLRFIGNMLHINKQSQDFVVSNSQYLKTCLSFTRYDPKQSQMREWSMVLIRNLSEGNIELQERISKMQ